MQGRLRLRLHVCPSCMPALLLLVPSTRQPSCCWPWLPLMLAAQPCAAAGPMPHHVIPHAPPQVPLMWTVYLQLAFRHFVLLGPRDEARQPGFFEVRGLIIT